MRSWVLSAKVLAILLAAAGVSAQSPEYPAPEGQWESYKAARAKTIVELQPFRREATAVLPSGEPVKLISLNPNVNASFLLLLGDRAFHIDNPDPLEQSVELLEDEGLAILLSRSGDSTRCVPWSNEMQEMESARRSELPFAPICGGRLYLRNTVSGSRSNLERMTDFLRDHVWQGENIVRVVKETLYRDEYALNSDLGTSDGTGCVEDGPCPAAISPRYAQSAISPIGFGIARYGADEKEMVPGGWYRALGLEGVFVSAMQPRTIDEGVLNGPGEANRLDSIEGKAIAYLVAFNLDRFGVGFALGTDHPRLDWSPRPRAAARIAGLPGPDGIRDAEPLVRSGMVPPEYSSQTVATFTAGFKRQHGAFKFGDYATIDTGKHYGFIEKGVIYSKLKTGLSTIYVLADGTVNMKTWSEEDNELLPMIAFARQNGVPLVTLDQASGEPVPGDRVNKWGPGNWSGSAKAELRTLRAGACLQHYAGRTYLIYGYFSTATPSAMARTFQAYGCSHAMLLDMNALEHTYLALYPRQGGDIHVEHLMTGMAQLDRDAGQGGVYARFLAFPDNRDLFFIYSRKEDE
ncbi:hypothetical protein [Ovoidimarina sediminis]|uniref:hypothetical protein n=1 Tax=Ovoidimarina sediminis TaxID=3079856 RepID=UPI002910B6F0|nr:hypothetical protein [Rhodophyticola sp. MJ-SS7]MDU8945789.1 hypothetical protein [Rhodophyticola sp. MJ-SS7]